MKNPQSESVINKVTIDDKIKFFKSFVVSDINFQTPLIILPMTLQNIVQKKLLRLVC